MLGIAAIAIVLGLRLFGVIGTLAAALAVAVAMIWTAREAYRYSIEKENESGSGSGSDQPKQGGDLSQDANELEWMAVRAHLKLAYQDAYGVRTDREVVVNKYYWDGDGYIEAFCKLRKESRTFRIDRIKEAVDLDTGEVLPVSRMRSWLRKRKI